MKTYIITPAENPKAIDKKLLLVVLVKNAIAAPIPVESPAARVTKKAINTFPSNISTC
jgi:hypothetical protein